jgi:hypothetical protein
MASNRLVCQPSRTNGPENETGRWEFSRQLLDSQCELRYALLIMATRDELMSLIEEMPEEKLDLVRMNLESILHPPAPNPMIEKVMRRAEEFQKQLSERLKELQEGNPLDSIRGFSGSGGFGGFPGKGNGEHSYSWQEGHTHVKHRFVLHDNHELDFVERLQLSEDKKALVYDQEIYAGGRSVKRREEFPVAPETE